MISFFGERKEKKLCKNTRRRKKPYVRTNVFKMIFSEMRLFVQKIIAF